MKTVDAVILQNIPIAKEIYSMILYFPQGFDTQPVPGQFINIEIPDKSHILRRPISISDVSVEHKAVTIIYQVKGEGTKEMSRLNAGEKINVFAFLGNGFTLPENAKKILLIGGGIGVAPMLYCAKGWSDVNFDAILGFRTADICYHLEEFAKVCGNVQVVTEDGTKGSKGYVTDVLKEYLKREKIDCIFTCGPLPMLRAVANMAAENDIDCFVSLEERMGCGMGACLVCNCKIKSADGFDYKRVCTDGPVFDAKEVIF
jgi:dihydroorotate dehydrogenase electron transfer subunit